MQSYHLKGSGQLCGLIAAETLGRVAVHGSVLKWEHILSAALLSSIAGDEANEPGKLRGTAALGKAVAEKSAMAFQ